MISLKTQIRDALRGVCPDVVYGYPRSFTGAEVVSWRESANRSHDRADGKEYLAELNYTLEIFACGAEAASVLLEKADGRMLEIGLRREGCAEQFEQDLGICHITARYRALADARGNIYQ